ncbi:MAG: HepT-like ribonuclease domain-containing protein [Candidatus Scalindua sediminis]
MDEKIFNSIGRSRGAISFRNILAHGYDMVDNVIVWGIIERDLSKLKHSIEKLME